MSAALNLASSISMPMTNTKRSEEIDGRKRDTAIIYAPSRATASRKAANINKHVRLL